VALPSCDPRDWLLERLKEMHVRIDTETPWPAGKGAQDNLVWLACLRRALGRRSERDTRLRATRSLNTSRATSDAVACATEQNVLGEGARWDARGDELLRVDHYQVIRDCQGELIRWNSLVCCASPRGDRLTI
jgi:hypothetical protein